VKQSGPGSCGGTLAIFPGPAARRHDMRIGRASPTRQRADEHTQHTRSAHAAYMQHTLHARHKKSGLYCAATLPEQDEVDKEVWIIAAVQPRLV